MMVELQAIESSEASESVKNIEIGLEIGLL
jgi:hypothetical protein